MAEQTSNIPIIDTDNRKNQLSDLFKRLFDIIVALFGLAILSPVFVWISWRIRRKSPGPIFYIAPRLGKGRREFNMVKFRTMYERPESHLGPRLTANGDTRVTPFGKWLRATKLNELPQLWNVLVGEMSLVGPRPEDPQVANQWPEAILDEILSVHPGITSPASVRFRDEENMLKHDDLMQSYLTDILPSKLRLDQIYVRHHTFWTDLDILFWTFLILLPAIRKYQPPDRRFFQGPAVLFMERYFNWFVVDLSITFLAISLTGLFWRSFGPLDVGWMTAAGFAIGFALLFSLMGLVFRTNRISWSHAAPQDILDLILPVLLATGMAYLANIYLAEIPAINPYKAQTLLPPALILLAAGIAFTGFVVIRYRGRLITGMATRWLDWRKGANTAQERVLIVGSGETGQFAAYMLSQRKYTGVFHVAGFVDDDFFKQGFRIRGANVLGSRAQIPDIVKRYDVGIIIFAIHNITELERRSLLDICASTSARVMMFPDIPATLNDMSRVTSTRHIDVNHSQEQLAFFDSTTILQCPNCPSLVQMDAWFAQLEEDARKGNTSAILHNTQTIRQKIKQIPSEGHNN